MTTKKLIILGSTGSIGTQTLEVAERFPEKFIIEGLSAHSNWKLLGDQAKHFLPRKVALVNTAHIDQLKNYLRGTGIEVLEGKEGLLELCKLKADMAVIALVGISGLLPTLTCLDTGKMVALANKEALVVGGEIVMEKSCEMKIPLIPIDSEHSAIFQCLNGENKKRIRRIILTSSGGPFRNTPSTEIKNKTAMDALKHPTWNMGKKVTVDSSTLMNKGFEVIEAKWLFDLSPEQIDVVIHPQSVIHSMVEFIDGSIIAQMSVPDMRIPIQYALSYPERLPARYVNTDFIGIGSLTFDRPRSDNFPCLNYAFNALQQGGTMPAVLNGANETAVSLFLENQITLGEIPIIINRVMKTHTPIPKPSIKELMDADQFARDMVQRIMRNRQIMLL